MAQIKQHENMETNQVTHKKMNTNQQFELEPCDKGKSSRLIEDYLMSIQESHNYK